MLCQLSSPRPCSWRELYLLRYWTGCIQFTLCVFSNIWINHTNKQYVAVGWCDGAFLQVHSLFCFWQQQLSSAFQENWETAALLGALKKKAVGINTPFRYQQPYLTELCKKGTLTGALKEQSLVLAKSGSFSRTTLLVQKSPSSSYSHIYLTKHFNNGTCNVASARSTVLLYLDWLIIINHCYCWFCGAGLSWCVICMCECTIRVVVLCMYCIYAHIKTSIKRKIWAQVWVLINLSVLCNSMLQSKE